MIVNSLRHWLLINEFCYITGDAINEKHSLGDGAVLHFLTGAGQNRTLLVVGGPNHDRFRRRTPLKTDSSQSAQKPCHVGPLVDLILIHRNIRFIAMKPIYKRQEISLPDF